MKNYDVECVFPISSAADRDGRARTAAYVVLLEFGEFLPLEVRVIIARLVLDSRSDFRFWGFIHALVECDAGCRVHDLCMLTPSHSQALVCGEWVDTDQLVSFLPQKSTVLITPKYVNLRLVAFDADDRTRTMMQLLTSESVLDLKKRLLRLSGRFAKPIVDGCVLPDDFPLCLVENEAVLSFEK